MHLNYIRKNAATWVMDQDDDSSDKTISVTTMN